MHNGRSNLLTFIPFVWIPKSLVFWVLKSISKYMEPDKRAHWNNKQAIYVSQYDAYIVLQINGFWLHALDFILGTIHKCIDPLSSSQKSKEKRKRKKWSGSPRYISCCGSGPQSLLPNETYLSLLLSTQTGWETIQGLR